MKRIIPLLLVAALFATALCVSCEDKSCPDDMVECDDGQGGTICVPKSVGC